MSKITKRTIENVKNGVNILDLAQEYFSLKRKGNCYQIESENGQFDSVMIYPETNSFYRWSRAEGGDVIKFVTELEIEGIKDFRDAVIFLQKRVDPNFLETPKKAVKEKRVLSKKERVKLLEEKLIRDINNKNAIAYLIKERGINKDVVYEGIKRENILQVKTENGTPGVAFIGRDDYNLLACVTIRGINNNSNFKGELKGCDYSVGWRWHPTDADGKQYLDPEMPVVCFESYIDMMSYMSLKEEFGERFNDGCTYIATGSATKYKAVLEFEQSNDLELNLNIANNLNCYELDPSIISLECYAEQVFQKAGIDTDDPSFAYFDFRGYGERYMLKKGAAMTPYGVASRNEQTFVWESARSVSDMVMQ